MGHQAADLDPLTVHAAKKARQPPAELMPAFYGFSDADMDREFFLSPITNIGGREKKLKLKEIVQRLQVSLILVGECVCFQTP